LILPVPCVRGVNRGSIIFLLSTASMYSHVPGDQGGFIFFRLKQIDVIQVVLYRLYYQFVINLIQICYIQICYIQFSVKSDR
jgi:hypothetical protein